MVEELRFRLQEFKLAELLNSRAGQIGLGALAGCFLGAVLSSQIKLAVLLVAAVLGLLVIAAAFSHPGPVLGVVIVATALIPTYAAPAAGPLLGIPAAGLAWGIVLALGWRNAIQRGKLFHPTAIDIAALAFFGLLYISLSFSKQVGTNEYLNIMLAWAGPFLAARMLLENVERPAFWVAGAFAVATVLVAPIALAETLGQENPFLNFQFNAGEAATWANAASREGGIRAEASFGHPIALSMWVSCSALLSLGMAINSSRRRERQVWLLLTVVALGVQAMTVSRTGWLILVLGVFLLAVTTAQREARRRLSGLFIAVGIGVFVLMLSGAAPKELQIIPSTSGGGEEARSYRDSGEYRERLLDKALEPGVLGLWGNAENKVTPASTTANTATDNAYIILADEWGLIPTFALFAVALVLLIAIIQSRKREMFEMVTLPITALGALGGLFFVAFITQQQVMVWLLVGAASGATEVARRRQAQRANPPSPPEHRAVP